MNVELIDSMGSDKLVVNAARVSFAKKIEKMGIKDERLIRFLAVHGHWSPFAHPHVCFYFRAPVFVARQLAKHQVGFAWNEISRRYVDFQPTYFHPTWRERAENKKQGSGGLMLGWKAKAASAVHDMSIWMSQKSYAKLLKLGVAPEQARAVLPQTMYTEWYWTGSLYGWSRVVQLRCHKDAQEETRQIVEQVERHMAELFPVSWRELVSDASRKEPLQAAA